MNKFKTKYGFFNDDGSEYIITTPKTPKPWVNVISNGTYGLVISQTGGGFSWDTHSEFNRITRWHQDLIQDNWGKYFYIKNNDTGEFWSPTWLPARTELDEYQCKHGLGYTTFTSMYKQIKIELTCFIPFEDNLEIWYFKITNSSTKILNLSIFTYLEWVLGSSNDYHREFHKQFLETRYSSEVNGLISSKRIWDIPLGDRGHWNIEYEYLGFISSNRKIISYEGDKESFIGQYGNLEKPKAVISGSLSKSVGPFNDSIGSLLVDLSIAPNETEELSFYIGLKKSEEEIINSLAKYKSGEQIELALNETKSRWNNILSPLEINTPDEAMNFSVNKWLRYQAISGRLWARTAYYQQSGAFGFRDQLQDSLVFLPIDSSQTIKQIRLHARHQKKDGTVLHWWHPITETGLETKMTDDLLWLPFVIIHFLEETNDDSILDLQEPFYDHQESESLYKHCCLAIDKVLSRFSDRGLPLIGAGDWNDGLSAVGLEMKGESIWLAEFLYYVLSKFIPVVEKRNDKILANSYSERAEKLREDFNKYAWDGDWFWRASKDSGEKLGSKECVDGQIFLNSQTWSVISNITDEKRKFCAMNSVKEKLIKKNGPLLLSPAYSKPDKYIGYLSRYAAGRRENGGVYSHAATWSVWAYSLLGESESAYDVYKRLCPIYSGLNPDEYVAEPYVMPGNIDGPDSPDYGMAGWTWYTGSASWFQKVIVDWILGVRANKEGLLIDPQIPNDWKGFTVKRTFRGTEFWIEVLNPKNVSSGVKTIRLNGEEISGNIIPHQEKNKVNVEVILG